MRDSYKIENKGNVHKTRIYKDRVEQTLNHKFKVSLMNETNRLNLFLKNNNIETAQILKQTKDKRILERLKGDFYDSFNRIQRKKAIMFLKKLHNILEKYDKRKATNQFYLVSQFQKYDELVWGDTKASNFLWRNGNPVGIVDYDTVSLGSVWYDVFMALITWGKNISHKEMNALIALYLGIRDASQLNWETEFRRFVLLKIKEISTNAFGLGYFVPRSRAYYKDRIKRLNNFYEKSFNRRSV